MDSGRIVFKRFVTFLVSQTEKYFDLLFDDIQTNPAKNASYLNTKFNQSKDKKC